MHGDLTGFKVDQCHYIYGSIKSRYFDGPLPLYLSSSPHLLWAAVLHNLGTQVATLDGPQVLLVGLAVTVILVQHVRSPGLSLRLDDSVPQLLSLNRFPSFTLLFISAFKPKSHLSSSYNNEQNNDIYGH